MTAILSMFGPDSILYALGAAVVVAFIAFMKGTLSGAERERNKQRAKEADAYEQSLKDLADAANARPSGSVSDDPYNRDNR